RTRYRQHARVNPRSLRLRVARSHDGCRWHSLHRAARRDRVARATWQSRGDRCGCHPPLTGCVAFRTAGRLRAGGMSPQVHARACFEGMGACVSGARGGRNGGQSRIHCPARAPACGRVRDGGKPAAPALAQMSRDSHATPLWTKLRGRSVAELRVRARQWLAAWSERAGISPEIRVPPDETFASVLTAGWAASPSSLAAALLRDFRARTTPRFFAAFGQRTDVVATLRSRWPDLERRVVAKAERARHGQFDFLGHSHLDFGDPVDWHRDPASGARPRDWHWSRIDYLNPKVAGDYKLIWELNRQQYFITLGKAYWYTGEALGLLYLGTLFPEFRCARRWQRTGWAILVEQLEKHVRPDGSYFEQSTYYHRYTTDFCLHLSVLGQLNGLPVEAAIHERLR